MNTEILEPWIAEHERRLEKYPELKKMYRQCFLSTYSTTMEKMPDDTTYVFTGDIPAMWLRDSSAQVTPYLPVASKVPEIKDLIKGVLERQYGYILTDPYANAFNRECNGHGHKDITKQNDLVWERKYEIDSLCYPFWLADKLFDATNDASVYSKRYIDAAKLAVSVLKKEQHHSEKSDYSFIREGAYAHDTLPNGGKGDEIPYTGMTWSAFRPSDDRCVYNYLVPSNMFAVVVLRNMAKVFKDIIHDESFGSLCESLAGEIDNGIKKFAVADHPVYGKIYAFEVDGKGNSLLMDDANVPSLLSLPYLGYCGADDKIYRNTRNFVLGKDNPYYFSGSKASGIGSPHTPDQYIWHIGIIMQALTSTDLNEKSSCLQMLLDTHDDTYFMHEGFHKDDPSQYSRPWFNWANSLFAIFIQNNIDQIDSLMKNCLKKSA